MKRLLFSRRFFTTIVKTESPIGASGSETVKDLNMSLSSSLTGFGEYSYSIIQEHKPPILHTAFCLLPLAYKVYFRRRKKMISSCW
jgi:hypothetical protein